MNNYNYFSDIESAFVRRRGKNLLLSPVDWALIESWEEQGIPLRIVLATIDELFDQVEADPKRIGSIRTLSYCKDAVEARFASWKESRVGAAEAADEAGPAGAGEDLADRLASLSKRLDSVASGADGAVLDVVTEAAARIRNLDSSSVDPEDIESELEELDEEIDSVLYGEASADRIAELESEVMGELGGKASRMDSDSLERTVLLMVRKRLRESSGIPGLGAFRL